jgi:hypothetical protein
MRTPDPRSHASSRRTSKPRADQRDALARERPVRVPERRGHGRRRRRRRLARDDVGVEARLAQADRGGQADRPGADHEDLWHGRASCLILPGS